MNLSSAARSWSISFLISSSLAPRSSACAQRFLRGAQRLLGVGDVAVLELTAIAHSRATTSRSSSSLLARASCQ